MRSTSLVLAALAGLAASAFAAPAGAFTPNSSAGIGPAAESIDPVASVHCRSFKHRSYNHGWGFGCRGGGYSVIHEREGRRGHVSVREREGRTSVGVRERSSTRSETNVRSRESTSTRGEAKSESSRSGTSGRSGTTERSGSSGNKSETGGGGGGGTTGQSSGSQR